MGFESTLSLKEHDSGKSKTQTIRLVTCESTVVEEVEKSLSEKPFLQVCLENKEGTESFDTVCDLRNNKNDVYEAITPKADILDLLISSEAPDDSLSVGCQTPRDSIFDPFAPGPEEVACAPRKKVTRVAGAPSRRQLNFDSGDYPVKRLSFDWSDSEEEDQCLQVIHKMILDLVISDCSLDGQEENEKIPIDSSPPESCKTPVSEPLLTGIATTCPEAPLKPSLKMSKLSPSICRKLDFDSVSPRPSVDGGGNS